MVTAFAQSLQLANEQVTARLIQPDFQFALSVRVDGDTGLNASSFFRTCTVVRRGERPQWVDCVEKVDLDRIRGILGDFQAGAAELSL